MIFERMHILVVDDDARLRSLLARYLRDNNFYVSVARDAKEARVFIKQYKLDIIILDVMMPNETGIEFLSKLRKESKLPVILLTAMGETMDRIEGLEKGADDYLPKPFEPKELLLRINNIIRRYPSERQTSSNKLNLGSCVFDTNKRELTDSNGDIIHITPVEQSLLSILGQKVAQVFSREQLADALGTSQSLRSIDVQITRLRKKIEEDSKNPRYLQTVRGKGYVLLIE